MIQVIVIFEFPDINDPDSAEADHVVEVITRMTSDMSHHMNCDAYVDEVEIMGESK